MINRAYGALTNGEVAPEDLGYRYSDCKSPEGSRASIARLMALVPKSAKGVFANLLIELLRSSDKWVVYIREWDKDNTYQTKVLADELYSELAGLQFSDIVAWADSVNHNSDEFSRTDNDTAIDRVCSALFSVIVAGD